MKMVLGFGPLVLDILLIIGHLTLIICHFTRVLQFVGLGPK